MNSIRLANLEDAAELLDIYTFYVLNTVISFEYTPPSLDEFKQRMVDKLKKFPWLVYEKNGRLLGYAYAAPFHERCAYDWSAEASIYVHADFKRQGIGKILYQALFEMLKQQGVINILAGITLPNNASVQLHEHFGFKQVALYKEIGFKFNQWLDVGYWQLALAKPEKPGPLQFFQR